VPFEIFLDQVRVPEPGFRLTELFGFGPDQGQLAQRESCTGGFASSAAWFRENAPDRSARLWVHGPECCFTLAETVEGAGVIRLGPDFALAVSETATATPCCGGDPQFQGHLLSIDPSGEASLLPG